MSSELSGLNSPLSYLGILATNPPRVVVVPRIPGINDRSNFSIGDLWVVKNMNQIWILVSVSQSRATWVNLFPGGGGALIFNTDNGIALPNANMVNFFGDTNISTTGSGNTITFDFSNGTNGQLLIGGGSAAQWNNLTSTGMTIGFMTNPNFLDLTANSFTGFASSFITDDSNSVIPSFDHKVNILGGNNIQTSGSGSTVTINLDDTIIVPGTIVVSSLSAGVVQSNASGLLSSNYGTNGQLLISSSVGAPSWNNLTSTGGSVTITNTANHINLDVTTTHTGTANFQFMAMQTTNLNNIVGNISTNYALGTSAALTKIFDVGNNVFVGSGTGLPATFTAPVTGLYFLSMCVNINLTTTANAQNGNWRIVTTQRTYTMNFRPGRYLFTGNATPTQSVLSHHVMANMTIGDTAQFQVNIGGVTPSSNVQGIFNNLTYISGFYLGA